MESKVQELEKELSNSLKENKNFSSKFLDTMTENVRLKENYDHMTNQNVIKQNRINELDEIVKNFENENQRLGSELTTCKNEMNKLESKNRELNE
jgi:predicted RNase H-like nuclease (RuvC/YqgF family)